MAAKKKAPAVKFRGDMVLVGDVWMSLAEYRDRTTQKTQGALFGGELFAQAEGWEKTAPLKRVARTMGEQQNFPESDLAERGLATLAEIASKSKVSTADLIEACRMADRVLGMKAPPRSKIDAALERVAAGFLSTQGRK